MISPKIVGLFASFALVLGMGPILRAQPEGVVSSTRREGVMETTAAQPEFFIFHCDNGEEHFDGTGPTIQAQGGVTQAEPITGLHYLRPRLTVNGSPWSPEDAKLLDAQFHGAPTGNFYLFKTIEGQIFYLPKEGTTRVVRVDYVLKNGRTVTVWMRK
jgi:hypothetical protein